MHRLNALVALLLSTTKVWRMQRLQKKVAMELISTTGAFVWISQLLSGLTHRHLEFTWENLLMEVVTGSTIVVVVEEDLVEVAAEMTTVVFVDHHLHTDIVAAIHVQDLTVHVGVIEKS
jgi:hypothetical protein